MQCHVRCTDVDVKGPSIRRGLREMSDRLNLYVHVHTIIIIP